MTVTPALANPTGVRVPRLDVDRRPFLVLMELTRACDLACRHCRAESQPARHPDELTTSEVRAVLDDLAGLGPPRPIVVLTGGDPFKRADLADLVAHGAGLGLTLAVSPSGTPLATGERLRQLRGAGARAVSLSIDGATPAAHDAFRGVPGSFDLTVAACRSAVDAGLHLQVNTTVTAGTVGELPDVLRLAADLGAGLLSVFFLVGTGRGRTLAPLAAADTEEVLHFLFDASSLVPLKTTEAPHYRRVVTERLSGLSGPGTGGARYTSLMARLANLGAPPGGPPVPSGEARLGPAALLPTALPPTRPLGTLPPARPPHTPPPAGTARPRRPPLAVGDGRGVVFVSHTGDVSPSGFLPLAVGTVRQAPLPAIYREAPLLRALRDPDRLGGRCGRCPYRSVCGGSRARAYATFGDPLAEDPACAYEP